MRPWPVTCVLAAMLGLAVQAPAAEPLAIPPLRAMSFNIRFDNPADGEDAWPKRRAKAVSLIRFHQADLVGLQEALRGQLADLEADLPGFAWFGSGRSQTREGEYSAILYRRERLELLEQDTFWLSETPAVPGSRAWDAALPRIVTWGRLRDRRSGSVFFVFNTHLDHMGEVARRESARLLAHRIREIAGQRGPVVVTGDFNSTADADPHRILTGSGGLRDAFSASACPHHGPTSTWNGFKAIEPARRIDFILVRPPVAVLQHAILSDTFDGRFASDHLPVLADVTLGRPSPEQLGSCGRESAATAAIRSARTSCASGRWDEARAGLRAALDSASGAERQRLLVELAMVAIERSSYHHHDPAGAAEQVATARGAVNAGGDPAAAARARFAEGRLAYGNGFADPSQWLTARELFLAARVGAAIVGDAALEAETVFYLGLVEQQQKHPGEARTLFEEGLARAQAGEDLFLESFLERHLAWLDEDAAAPDLAERRFRRSLELRQRLGATVFVPFARIALAAHLDGRGRHDEAIALWRRAADEAESSGSWRAATNALLSISRALKAGGDTAGARAALTRAERSSREYADPDLLATVAGALAAIR